MNPCCGIGPTHCHTVAISIQNLFLSVLHAENQFENQESFTVNTHFHDGAFHQCNIASEWLERQWIEKSFL